MSGSAAARLAVLTAASVNGGPRRACRPAVGWLAVLVFLAGLPPASGANPQEAAAAAGEAFALPDPCATHAPDDPAGLDRFRAGMERSVCQTSRWFDGLFGDPRQDEASDPQVYGRAGAGLGWDEDDGTSLAGHLRAYFPLPRFNRRFNAVIGRDSGEEFIGDDFNEANFLAASFTDDRDASWYAGLNYQAASGPRDRFDVTSGVQLASPLNPYLKARYTHAALPAPDVLLTTRATAFWEDRDGFGLTLAADADWVLSETWLARWANTLGYSESTAGLRWKTRLGLYQVLNPRSAMRYDVSVRGETDGRQPDLYGMRITHRRAVLRDWLFVELSSSLFWARREHPTQRCAACVGVAAGFEVLFGDRYDRLLERSRNPGEDAPL